MLAPLPRSKTRNQFLQLSGLLSIYITGQLNPWCGNLYLIPRIVQAKRPPFQNRTLDEDSPN